MRAHTTSLLLAAALGLPALADPMAPQPAPPGPALGAPDDEVQRIHVIEVRPFTEAGRFELSLFGPVQVNAHFTRHAGVAAELAYHLRENLAAQLGLAWFPLARQSGFAEELILRARQEPVAANALLLQAAVLAGLEMMPVYGKLNIFDGKILRVGFYLNASLGAGKTRLQLSPARQVVNGVEQDSRTGRSYGDTGVRPMAALGAGFRVFINERITLRIELRDLVYSAYVSRVNGCTVADTDVIVRDGAAAQVSPGCNISAFNDESGNPKLRAAAAGDQIRTPSADVINNLTAYTGLSWLF
jgi:outer membrane beta-barrel protein